MKKQGGIILGVGGDNSHRAIGTFYEGVMTTGFSSDAADNAVQSNVASVYGSASSALKSDDITFDIDMFRFLSRHDLAWDFRWREGDPHIPTHVVLSQKQPRQPFSIATLPSNATEYHWFGYRQRVVTNMQMQCSGDWPSQKTDDNEVCGKTGYPSYCAITASCDGSATIATVAFADWGGLPTGSCGAFHPDPKCSTPAAKAWVQATCLGKRSCTLNPAPGGVPIKALGDPCYGSVKDLVVQLACSGGANGSITTCPRPPPPPSSPPSPPQMVHVDWTRPAGVGISRTTTTLQVVTNPILDRVFSNGMTNPIHANAWASLKNLTADYARFVPWYPYPRRSVAELLPPVAGQPTSWNFTLLIPQLEDFFRSTADQGKDTIVNFATQPCWMFNKNLSWCTPPTNPDEAYFNYASGGVQTYYELDKTGKTLAEYYARLIGYLMTGEMTDEHGVKHVAPTGQRKFNFSVWEVFNEGEHGYDFPRYMRDFDQLVSTVRREVPDAQQIRWMGVGGTDPNWIPSFLDPGTHNASLRIPPPFGASSHYYSGSSGSDGDAFARDFFDGADGLIDSVRAVILPNTQHSRTPGAKLDIDELGVLGCAAMSNDPQTAGIKPIYWNAAAAMQAYVFGKLVLDGADILGFSQFAGNPPLPDWDIPNAQFPGVSMIDWNTGLGNARYWCLKLLIDHFAPGDRLISTDSSATHSNHKVDTTKPLAATSGCANLTGTWAAFSNVGEAPPHGQWIVNYTVVQLSGSEVQYWEGSYFGSNGTVSANHTDIDWKTLGAATLSSATGVKGAPPCSEMRFTGTKSLWARAPWLPFPAKSPPGPPPSPPGPPGPPPAPPGGLVPAPAPTKNGWCAEAHIHSKNYSNTWFLRCPQGSTINIEWADFGGIGGNCDKEGKAGAGVQYQTDPACTTATEATAYMQRQCGGKRACITDVNAIPVLGYGPSSCRDIKRLVVQASCSGGQSALVSKCVPWKTFNFNSCFDAPFNWPVPKSTEPWPYDSTPLPSPSFYALAVRTEPSDKRKVLLVNKRNANVSVAVPADGTLFVVDPASVGAASADGIRQEVVTGKRVELLPFAVAVLVVSETEAAGKSQE